jgi:hypothetical protein
LGGNTSALQDSGKFHVHDILTLGRLANGIGLVSSYAVVNDVLESLVHEAAITALVSILDRAFDQLLGGQLRQRAYL